jgi:hypothetical protein
MPALGQHHDEAARAKMRLSRVGVVVASGWRHTLESRRKISLSRRDAEARGLTDAQLADYRLFRKKGCTKMEAALLAVG